MCTDMQFYQVKYEESSVAPGSQALVAVPADLYRECGAGGAARDEGRC